MNERFKFYYSGQRSSDVSPEDYLEDFNPAIMLTFADFYKKQSSEGIRRFEANRKKPKSKRAKLIMDSGATFIYNRFIKKNTKGAPGTYIKDKRRIRYGYEASIDLSFYETKEFKDFRDAYIEFVLKNDKYLDGYVNMDVINDAEGSYKAQKFMEARGCHPMPVYHLTDAQDDIWLQRYIDNGYDWICIGGITPNPVTTLLEPLDRIWSNILTDKDGMPKVKVHGLACTSHRLLFRYPWYSADSATWTKLGAWGGIYVPRKVAGAYSFGADSPPYGIQVSTESSKIGDKDNHFIPLGKATPNVQKAITDWLDYIGVPIGAGGKVREKEMGGGVIESIAKRIPSHGVDDSKQKKGVINDYQCRMMANLSFWQAMEEALPDWPRPFEHKEPTLF